MTGLSVRLSTRDARAVPDLHPRLGGGEGVPTSWEGPGARVRTWGTDVSLAIEDDLVVVVMGRVGPLAVAGRVGDSSAQRVLHAWRQQGPEVFRGLRDDVVVTVLQPLVQRVTVFRDLTGALPAFLTVEDGILVMDSSFPSLVSGSGRLTVDERWVQAFLRGRWPAADVSPYADIVSLPAGYVATGDARGWRYGPADRWDLAELAGPDPNSSASTFRRLFDDAVRRRVETVPGPVAVTLSGGLDSSSVAVTVRAVAPDVELIALSLSFQDALGDERSYQEDAARAAGARLVRVDPTRVHGPFGETPEALFDRYGAPLLGGNWFLHEGLVAAARAEGVLRVLDGEDGDGVVGAQPSYLSDLLAGEGPLALAREASAAAKARGVPARELWRTALTESVRSARAGTWGRAQARDAASLLEGGYLSWLGAETFVQYEGLAGAIAHPFLDRTLVEHVIPLPGEHKAGGGVNKLVLRRAMAQRLPPSISGRKDKARLSDPFVTALRGPQWDILQDGLAGARRRAPDMTDVPVVDRVTTGPDWLYRAYRVAVVDLWRTWVASARATGTATLQASPLAGPPG